MEAITSSFRRKRPFEKGWTTKMSKVELRHFQLSGHMEWRFQGKAE
jgi:hypothetical protein